MKNNKTNYLIIFILLLVLLEFYVTGDTNQFLLMIVIVFGFFYGIPFLEFVIIHKRYGKLQTITNEFTNKPVVYYGTASAFYTHFEHDRKRLNERILGQYAVLINGVYICKVLSTEEVLTRKDDKQMLFYEDKTKPVEGFVTNHGRLIKSLTDLK